MEKKSKLKPQEFAAIDLTTGDVYTKEDGYDISCCPKMYSNAIAEVEKNRRKRRYIEAKHERDEMKRINKILYDDFAMIKYIADSYLPLKESGISMQNICRVIYLSTFMSYENKLITDNNVTMTRKFMFSIMNLTDKPFRDFLKEVKSLGILIEDKENKCFYLSEKYFHRGHTTLKENKEFDFMFVFKTSMRNLYLSVSPYQHKTLSYLFALIPFVHFKKNVICHNVKSKNFETSKPFNLTEIANVVGVSDEQILKKELLNLKVNNHYVITKASFCSDRVQFWVINEIVFHHPQFDSKESLQDLFKIAELIDAQNKEKEVC